MRTFVINLDRRVGRWAWVREHLADRSIPITRFPAIDKKPGWMGCRDSHLRILELYREEDRLIIFEDDIEFLDHLYVAYRMMDQLPADWDCLYLGGSPQEPQERYSENLFKIKNVWTTHAIIWNNRKGGAIDYIIDHKDDIKKWDVFLASVIQPKFNCFMTFPMIVHQRVTNESDTCTRSDVTTIDKNYSRFCI